MSGTKPYNQLREQLDGLTTHPAYPALDRENAWQQLERLRAEQNRAPVSIWRRSAIKYPLWGAAALLLLYFSYRFFQPAPVKSLPYTRATSSFPKNETASATPLENNKMEVVRQAEKSVTPSPVVSHKQNKKNNQVPTQVLAPKPDTVSIPAIASASEPLIDETGVQPIISATPKKIYHLNELRDPDRPYSINKQKKRSTVPVAKQEKGFTITIPISN
ncbi:hypothetical protein L0U88_15900 [Flavihumibacter sp. RY-1]|uniref:Uncharacterized protein n=1 Tax=Flavihumibacter fluminis TaxID=2909236 RepID=A0ABS9BMS9_9BACT|nr:hypothetical protein [Flavihumibacter fluminis]MCF1716124.1 hypothetical protein [Flavihumibacter fluminis]